MRGPSAHTTSGPWGAATWCSTPPRCRTSTKTSKVQTTKHVLKVFAVNSCFQRVLRGFLDQNTPASAAQSPWRTSVRLSRLELTSPNPKSHLLWCFALSCWMSPDCLSWRLSYVLHYHVSVKNIKSFIKRWLALTKNIQYSFKLFTIVIFLLTYPSPKYKSKLSQI